MPTTHITTGLDAGNSSSGAQPYLGGLNVQEILSILKQIASAQPQDEKPTFHGELHENPVQFLDAIEPHLEHVNTTEEKLKILEKQLRGAAAKWWSTYSCFATHHDELAEMLVEEYCSASVISQLKAEYYGKAQGRNEPASEFLSRKRLTARRLGFNPTDDIPSYIRLLNPLIRVHLVDKTPASFMDLLKKATALEATFAAAEQSLTLARRDASRQQPHEPVSRPPPSLNCLATQCQTKSEPQRLHQTLPDDPSSPEFTESVACAIQPDVGDADPATTTRSAAPTTVTNDASRQKASPPSSDCFAAAIAAYENADDEEREGPDANVRSQHRPPLPIVTEVRCNSIMPQDAVPGVSTNLREHDPLAVATDANRSDVYAAKSVPLPRADATPTDDREPQRRQRRKYAPSDHGDDQDKAATGNSVSTPSPDQHRRRASASYQSADAASQPRAPAGRWLRPKPSDHRQHQEKPSREPSLDGGGLLSPFHFPPTQAFVSKLANQEPPSSKGLLVSWEYKRDPERPEDTCYSAPSLLPWAPEAGRPRVASQVLTR